MKQKTLNALKASIAHWRRFATGTSAPGERIGPDDCALCCEFLIGTSHSCDGCPVMQETGRSACLDTPYGNADRAYFAHGKDSKQFKASAKKEFMFLRSLLPKKKKSQTDR